MTTHSFEQAVTFLYVTDLGRSLHFYETTLGLKTALIQTGCTILSIDQRSTAFLGLCTCDAPRSTEGMILTLVSKDLDAIYSALNDHGYQPETRPSYNERYNITHFFVNDPDGHLVEIQTFHDPAWPAPAP